MVSFFLITEVILFVTVTCQDYGLVHFMKDENTFFECIENHLNPFWYDQNPRMREILVNEFVQTYFHFTLPSVLLDEEIPLRINYLIRKTFFYLDRRRSRSELEGDIKAALLNCTYSYIPDSLNQSTSESSDRVALPYFIHEPPEQYRFLNYVLVNLRSCLDCMSRNENDRALLRRYTEGGLSILERDFTALCNYNLQHQLWDYRADIFFDDRNDQFPYIVHRYTLNFSAPHTYGDTSTFVNRSIIDFTERNPPLSQSLVTRILSLHPIRDPVQGGDGIYMNYAENGMSSSDYYFEIGLSRFFSILFFYLELLDRDLLSKEGDYYNVPENVGRILYDDNYYHDYLLFRCHYELSISNTDSVYRREVEQYNFISERGLVMMFWTRIRNRMRTTTTSTIPPVGTKTTVVHSTSTPKYQELKADKRKFDNDVTKKCSLKNSRTVRMNYIKLTLGRVSNEPLIERSCEDGPKFIYYDHILPYSVDESFIATKMIIFFASMR